MLRQFVAFHFYTSFVIIHHALNVLTILEQLISSFAFSRLFRDMELYTCKKQSCQWTAVECYSCASSVTTDGITVFTVCSSSISTTVDTCIFTFSRTYTSSTDSARSPSSTSPLTSFTYS